MRCLLCSAVAFEVFLSSLSPLSHHPSRPIILRWTRITCAYMEPALPLANRIQSAIRRRMPDLTASIKIKCPLVWQMTICYASLDPIIGTSGGGEHMTLLLLHHLQAHFPINGLLKSLTRGIICGLEMFTHFQEGLNHRVLRGIFRKKKKKLMLSWKQHEIGGAEHFRVHQSIIFKSLPRQQSVRVQSPSFNSPSTYLPPFSIIQYQVIPEKLSRYSHLNLKDGSVWWFYRADIDKTVALS